MASPGPTLPSFPQSALEPAGRDAAQIAELFWWMAGGALLVWAAVMAVALYAIWRRRREHARASLQRFVLLGGVVFPTLALGLLLVFGLRLLPALLDAGAEDGPRVRVTGEQWWWRVRYELPDGQAVELANELRLPRGRRAAIALAASDVIHSFWVPSLAGKMDMIPGRETRLALEPTREGVFQGVCAEFCGTSHTQMRFPVVVLGENEFRSWLDAQRQPARAPVAGTPAARGAELFLMLGCRACHTVRGTNARGVIGPDLTHVGGRLQLGAGALQNDVDAFVHWLKQTSRLKPGVHMPAFPMLPEPELRALASYLDGLR